MKIKALIIATALTLSLLTSTVFATGVDNFTDVQGHWAYDTIEIMVDNGIMNGVSTTSFAPDDIITYGEVLAIATRLVAPEYIEVDAFSGKYNEENYHWAADYYVAAAKSGIVNDDDLSFLDSALLLNMMPSFITRLNESVSREGMAVLLCKIAEVNGETLTEVSNIGYNIGDYMTIEPIDTVKTVYSEGLMTGVDAIGTFNPDGRLTRAETATIFARLMNYIDRVDVVVNAPTDENGEIISFVPKTTSIDANGVMTIYQDHIRTTRLAQEGDIFIKTDGTQIVLAIGPNGVLGEGQGVAADLGMTIQVNGIDRVLEHDMKGHLDGATDSLGNAINNQYYWVNILTGEGHWGMEWTAIAETSMPIYGTPGYDYQLSDDMNYYFNPYSKQWISFFSVTPTDTLMDKINSANGL